MVTLLELDEQLRNARVDLVRVHRSHLVNRAKVCEVSPTRSGDMLITMIDGTVSRDRAATAITAIGS